MPTAYRTLRAPSRALWLQTCRQAYASWRPYETPTVSQYPIPYEPVVVGGHLYRWTFSVAPQRSAFDAVNGSLRRQRKVQDCGVTGEPQMSESGQEQRFKPSIKYCRFGTYSRHSSCNVRFSSRSFRFTLGSGPDRRCHSRAGFDPEAEVLRSSRDTRPRLPIIPVHGS